MVLISHHTFGCIWASKQFISIFFYYLQDQNFHSCQDTHQLAICQKDVHSVILINQAHNHLDEYRNSVISFSSFYCTTYDNRKHVSTLANTKYTETGLVRNNYNTHNYCKRSQCKQTIKSIIYNYYKKSQSKHDKDIDTSSNQL